MAGLICSGGASWASRRFRALALAVLCGVLVFPDGARAQDCVERMSRVPMASPAAPSAPKYRAAMMRSGPKPRPAAAARPRVVKASGPAVRKARPVRKAAVHRPARKKAPIARRVAVAKPARVYPTPTPMPVAAARLATPLSYALVSATICETGPAAAPIAPLRLAMARAPLEPEASAPGPDAGTFAPPFIVSPGPGDEGPVLISPGTPGNPVSPPVAPPGEEPPPVFPPVTEPPTGEPPVTPPGEEPPIVTPPTVVPPIDQPPVFPPGVEPPIGPPVGPPPTTPVPEPGTWALMILGFGLLGARLRRRRDVRA
jgi:hypothetical protein